MERKNILGWLSFVLSLPLLIKTGADQAGIVIPYVSDVSTFIYLALQAIGLPMLAQSQPVIKKQ